MKMTIQQLDELVTLLEQFEKDETIIKINNDKLNTAIKLIKETAIDIII